jgi:two-component system CheB/CheR fusion protein
LELILRHAQSPPRDDPRSNGRSGPPAVVSSGASAGGLEALRALTKRLARDGLALVVIQHLAPGHESLPAEIHAGTTAFPVGTARDGIALAPDTIHVAPPNVEIALEGEMLRVRPRDARDWPGPERQRDGLAARATRSGAWRSPRPS